MAAIDLTKGTSTGKGLAALYGKPMKTVYALIDLQDAVTSKGSALAAGDTISALRIPAGSRVAFAGAKVIEAVNAGTLHFSVGPAGDTARFVPAFNGFAESTGFCPLATVSTNGTFLVNSSPTTIEMAIGTYSGTTLTSGVIAVFADVADYSEFAGSTIDSTNIAGVPQS